MKSFISDDTSPRLRSKLTANHHSLRQLGDTLSVLGDHMNVVRKLIYEHADAWAHAEQERKAALRLKRG